MSHQQPPDHEADTVVGLPVGDYQDARERALNHWFGAPRGQQTQPPPGRQEPQFRYPPPQPYDQRPRQPSFTPDPQYSRPPGQPAYRGQPQYPQQPFGGDPYPQGQPYGQQPYLPQGHPQHSYQEAPRKRRRVFLWIFLTIQVLFIAWIVAGIASKPAGTPIAQQVAQQCGNGGWQGLFKSYSDCTKHYAVALNDASNAGKGIGAAVIVAVWFVVDVILGISYGVYKLARRGA